jgi:hypothetical protein
MTSRDAFEKRLQDHLDVKIRWVLHEIVSDAVPPSNAWRQIVERLTGPTRWGQTRRWREFCLACRGLVLWLLDTAVDLPAEFAYCRNPGLSDVRDRDYLRLLMYQCDLPVLLGHTM